MGGGAPPAGGLPARPRRRRRQREGRLESLKVLYDAGILDREEYTQRVARVKSRHTLRQ